MAGPGNLKWPDDPEKALGMRLLLFRAFAERRPDRDIAGFGIQHINVGQNLNDNARAVIDQIFRPMARELRRYLEGTIGEVPAADRFVKLDHNSAAYHEAIKSLEDLEKTLHEANDYPDPEDKDQRIAEISAAQRLLKAIRVRVAAVVELVGAGLRYLASHFIGTAIDTASHKVIEALTNLFGALF
jgi:protein-tyrosine-phosphatase